MNASGASVVTSEDETVDEPAEGDIVGDGHMNKIDEEPVDNQLVEVDDC